MAPIGSIDWDKASLVIPPTAKDVITLPVVSEMAFSFTGVCSDCDGTAHAELVLKDYTLGDTMGDANLVSFTTMAPIF
jgi:hypothetical protein